MPKILTPRLQYDSTAARPRWSQLPQHVRDLIERHLGGAVHAEESAGGGFTSGYAAVVEGTHGSQFVKAVDARTNTVVAECYRREALINEALPSAVPAPRQDCLRPGPRSYPKVRGPQSRRTTKMASTFLGCALAQPSREP
jgi:hypothetical protein